MPNNYMTIRISDELRSRLRRFADADHRSMSNLVKHALERYADERDKEKTHA